MNDFVYEKSRQGSFLHRAASLAPGRRGGKNCPRRALLVSYAKKNHAGPRSRCAGPQIFGDGGSGVRRMLQRHSQPLAIAGGGGAPALCPRAEYRGDRRIGGAASVMGLREGLSQQAFCIHNPLRRMIMFSHSEATRIPPETAAADGGWFRTVRRGRGSEMNPHGGYNRRPTVRPQSVEKVLYMGAGPCLFPRVAPARPGAHGVAAALSDRVRARSTLIAHARGGLFQRRTGAAAWSSMTGPAGGGPDTRGAGYPAARPWPRPTTQRAARGIASGRRA